MNVAAQDVRTRLQSQAAALRQFTTNSSERGQPSGLVFPSCFFWILVSPLDLDFFRGGASAHPLGVVPEFRVGC